MCYLVTHVSVWSSRPLALVLEGSASARVILRDMGGSR